MFETIIWLHQHLDAEVKAEPCKYPQFSLVGWMVEWLAYILLWNTYQSNTLWTHSKISLPKNCSYCVGIGISIYRTGTCSYNSKNPKWIVKQYLFYHFLLWNLLTIRHSLLAVVVGFRYVLCSAYRWFVLFQFSTCLLSVQNLVSCIFFSFLLRSECDPALFVLNFQCVLWGGYFFIKFIKNIYTVILAVFWCVWNIFPTLLAVRSYDTCSDVGSLERKQ